MAYPTQLRGSLDPWVSQVLEDSVIRMRRKRAGTGESASFKVTVPPSPSFTRPPGMHSTRPTWAPSWHCLIPSNTELRKPAHKDRPSRCESPGYLDRRRDQSPPTADEVSRPRP